MLVELVFEPPELVFVPAELVFVLVFTGAGVEAGVDIFVLFTALLLAALLFVALLAVPGSQAIPIAAKANKPDKAIVFFIFLILLSSSKII